MQRYETAPTWENWDSTVNDADKTNPSKCSMYSLSKSNSDLHSTWFTQKCTKIQRYICEKPIDGLGKHFIYMYF